MSNHLMDNNITLKILQLIQRQIVLSKFPNGGYDAIEIKLETNQLEEAKD